MVSDEQVNERDKTMILALYKDRTCYIHSI